MARQPKFVGYSLRKSDFKNVISLIELTVGRIGIHKRHFKDVNSFWKVIEAVTGLGHIPGESFERSIQRAADYVRGLSKDKKIALMAQADHEALFAAVEISRPDVILVKDATAKFSSARQPRKPRAPRVAKPRKPSPIKGKYPTKAEKDAFYADWPWRTLRFETLQKHGSACQCCGATKMHKDMAGNPVQIVVDHIKPISKHWHLRLDPQNLQVLCQECNMGKGNWDETDFRSPEAPDEWVEAPQDDIVLSVLDELNGGSTIQ